MTKNVVKILWSIVALLVCMLILFVERGGVRYQETFARQNQNNIPAVDELVFTEEVNGEIECLLIVHSEDYVSESYQLDLEFILESMKIAYEVVDLKNQELPNLEGYRTVVLACSDLSFLGEQILVLCDWVEAGGRLMNTNTYELNSYFYMIARKLGIIDSGKRFVTVGGVRVLDEFMIGGNKEFSYEKEADIAIEVQLHESCQVYLEETEEEIPLLWEHSYGKGKFVTVNQTITGKANRGFLSAAYSLLDDVSIYPVINASTFYIDDFPAPMPQGKSEVVVPGYSMDIFNFYANVWWKTLLSWQEEYGILHTGMMIETYSDTVKAPFDRQLQTDRFLYFGNMLLNRGGELGWHGYNHIPLLLDKTTKNKTTKNKTTKNEAISNQTVKKETSEEEITWESIEDMKASLSELEEFSKDLYQSQEFRVYAPPENQLSIEGREVIKKHFSNILILASTYLEGEGSYSQEFEVSDDGFVETPRITSGYNMEGYMDLIAFSELNFHYVQSHQMHQYEILDYENKDSFGWEVTAQKFKEYLEYIYTSAPSIRNVTGSQMGTAVAQYDTLSVKREWNEGELVIHLGGFSNEAYLMMRINEGNVASMKGASYEHVAGNLYLVHANESTIVITWEGLN